MDVKTIQEYIVQSSDAKLAEAQPILFEVLSKISQGLAATFGDVCEVVIHDLSDPTTSIVQVSNGHVTNRQVGGGIRDLAMILRSDRFQDDTLSNYITRTEDGKVVKSMTVVIRNEQRDIIGAFCLNFDLGKFLSAKAIIEEFAEGYELEATQIEKRIQDSDVLSILRHIILRTIDEAGLPVSEMDRNHKVRIVRFLDEKEVFLIKGAVDFVADTLNVSRYTIYNYLDEVRAKRSRDRDSEEEPTLLRF